MTTPSKPFPRSAPRRAQIGTAVVAAYALSAAAALLVRWWPLIVTRPAEDLVSAHERRLRPLRQMLSPHEFVGYVSHEGPGAQLREETTQRYILTLYGLAPALVVPDAARHPVVGNYPYTALERPPEIPEGYSVLRDFGDGVLLLAPPNR